MDECSRGGYHVEQVLVVNATVDFNTMPVQCSLLCFEGQCGCSAAQVQFSKSGLLKVQG